MDGGIILECEKTKSWLNTASRLRWLCVDHDGKGYGKLGDDDNAGKKCVALAASMVSEWNSLWSPVTPRWLFEVVIDVMKK